MEKIVYILGTTRSGTSALRNALSRTRFAGYGEGHLAPLLVEIINSVRQQRETGLGCNVPGNGLFNLKTNVLIRRLFAAYEHYLETELGSAYLLDKTPTVTPIRNALELQQFHRNARFLHCARRHVDNIDSKRRKFPEQSFVSHCQEWVACMEGWLEVSPKLGDASLGFDFHELTTDPHGVAGRIGAFLGLDDTEIAAMGEYLVGNRPQAAPDRDLLKSLTLDEVSWTDDEKDLFVRLCGPTGKRYGYGFDSYFEKEGAAATGGRR